MKLLHNLHLKILAILGAILFWIFIVGVKNPIYEFPELIDIKPFNLSDQWSVAQDIGKVELRITTDKETWQTLKKEDFESYVDLKDNEEGTYVKEVFVTSKNPKIQIISFEPESAKVTIEPVKQAKFPIETVVKGSPLEGYQIQKIELKPAEIAVKAGASTLEKIKETKTLKAELTLSGNETGSIEKELALLLDPSLLQRIKIEPSKIMATVTFEKKLQEKLVGIRANVIGSVQNGTIEQINIEPAVLTILATDETLEKISTLKTEPLNIKNLSKTETRTTKVILPEGVKLPEGATNEVQVTFVYKPL